MMVLAINRSPHDRSLTLRWGIFFSVYDMVKGKKALYRAQKGICKGNTYVFLFFL